MTEAAVGAPPAPNSLARARHVCPAASHSSSNEAPRPNRMPRYLVYDSMANEPQGATLACKN
eukprot:2972786-Pyramimonas_sp.AAC.1